MILPIIIGLAIGSIGLAVGYWLRGTWLGAKAFYFTYVLPALHGVCASIVARDESLGHAIGVIIFAVIAVAISGAAGWHYAEADRCRRARVAMGAGR